MVDDGALERRLARIEGTLNNLRSMEIDLSSAGTAFPTSVPTGFRYFRTDLLQEYDYDGAHWLGTLQIAGFTPTNPNTFPVTAPNSMYLLMAMPANVTFVDAMLVTKVGGTSNSTNYWTVTLYSGVGGVNVFTQSTASDSSNTNTRHPQTILNSYFVASTELQMVLSIVPTGTPGPLTISWTIRYRDAL